MHERGVVSDVVRHAERLCRSENAAPTRVRLSVGVLSGFSPDSVSHYFRQLIEPGSPLVGCEVEVTFADQIDPSAMGLTLDSLEFGPD